MAGEYDPVQSVAPQVSSPGNLLGVRATPQNFGAQIGAATQGLGQSVEGVGQEQFDTAVKYQQMSNEYTANTSAMKFADFTQQQEFNLHQQEGENAKNALPGYQKSLQDKMSEMAAGIQSPMARNAFLQDARNFYDRSMYSAGLYVGDEVKKSTTQSYLDKTKSIINFTTANVNVPGTLDTGIRDVVNSSLSYAHHQGITDPDSANAIVQTNVGDLLSSVVTAKMGQGKTVSEQTASLKQAEDLYQKYKDQTIPGSPGVPVLDASHSDHIQASLQYRDYLLQGRQGVDDSHEIANSIFGGSGRDYQQQVIKQPLPDVSKSELGMSGQTLQSNPSPKVFTGVGAKSDLTLQQSMDKFKDIESGGSSPASIEARQSNPYQIQKGTFDEHKLGGENFESPADRIAVSERLFKQYVQKYGGDLSRIAVAWNSSSNVAPEGSPTPWKKNFTDPKTGETTADYVYKATGINYGQGSTTQTADLPPQQTYTDYLKQHLPEYIQKSRDEMERRYPGNAKLSDEAANQTEQRFRKYISDQEEVYKANTDTVQRFVYGDGTDKGLVKSEDQLRNGPPNVAEAWKHMQHDTPGAAKTIKNVITANGRGQALTYGIDFWKHFEDMLTGKVTDIGQLSPYIGSDKNSPITNTGFAALNKEMQYAQTPEGHGFAQAERAYFEKLRTDIVGGLGVRNVEGEKIFNSAVSQALRKIQSGRAAGLGPGELFDKDSSDYVGDSKVYDGRSQDQKLKDMITTKSTMTQGQFFPQPQKPFKSEDFDKITDHDKGIKAIQDSVKGKKLSPQEYDAIGQYLIKRGWAQEPPRQVPLTK